MIEFAIWIAAMAVVCGVMSGIFFIAAPAWVTSLWSVLGVITGLTTVALGGVLAIMGLGEIIRTVAMSMGF